MTVPRFHGIDFSSAPTRRKPIVIARLVASVPATWTAQAEAPLSLVLEGFERLDSLAAFDVWLAAQRDWVAGCDFPFGLPRAFIDAQGWPGDWLAVTGAVAALSRLELVDRCRAWCAARPVGQRFAHRATDRPAGSSPSMKWVNPPVVLMLHAGAPRLAAAGVDLPGLRAGDPSRVALEAYPGLFAREVLGRRSYKNDDPRRDDAGRRQARATLVAALAQGSTRLGLPVRMEADARQRLVAEHTADSVDAVICAVQAAWGWRRRASGFGRPADVDPCEGWIVTAPAP
jgi:hypothetical protein